MLKTYIISKLIYIIVLVIIIINLDYVTKTKASAYVIPLYATYYNIDTHSIDPNDYSCFNDYFTRKVDRLIGKGLVSPVDGEIVSYGSIDNDTMIQAKGKTYSCSELLGFDLPQDNLQYITFYLSPRNYHRIHCPFDGKLIFTKDISANWNIPVNKLAINNINGIYTNNKRSILVFETELGLLILVLIGSIFVNSIEHVVDHTYYNKGDSLGKFNFGSTVIMIYSPYLLKLDDKISILYSEIEYGNSLKKTQKRVTFADE